MKVFHRFLYYSLLLSLSVLAVSCKKKGGTTPPPTGDTTTVNPQVDPPLANTIGFFMDDWQPRTFTVPSTFTNTTVPAAAGVTVTVDRSNVITKVPRSFASNNANLWMGQMVTETSLMTNLTNLHPHLIRFPGGSISDVFFWNAQPNTPPADAPAQLLQDNGTPVAAGFWYGKNTASWTFSVDNFYSMLQRQETRG
jgi:hypothetical protein